MSYCCTTYSYLLRDVADQESIYAIKWQSTIRPTHKYGPDAATCLVQHEVGIGEPGCRRNFASQCQPKLLLILIPHGHEQPLLCAATSTILMYPQVPYTYQYVVNTASTYVTLYCRLLFLVCSCRKVLEVRSATVVAVRYQVTNKLLTTVVLLATDNIHNHLRCTLRAVLPCTRYQVLSNTST